MEGTLTQRRRYTTMEPSEFRSEIGRLWDGAGKVIDQITDLVESEVWSPLIAAEVIACATATIFGYQELHATQQVQQGGRLD